MDSSNVIRAAKSALFSIRRMHQLRPQLMSDAQYEIEVAKLEEATINLIKELCGSDSEVASQLGELYKGPRDPSSSLDTSTHSGRESSSDRVGS